VHTRSRHRSFLFAALGACVALGSPLAWAADEPAAPWRGRSGALKVLLAAPGEALPLPQGQGLRFVPLREGGAPIEALAATAPLAAGAYRVQVQREDGWQPLEALVVTRVAHRYQEPKLNGYHIGRHPGFGRGGAYEPPELFVEVTAEDRDLRVSESFRLGQFLTKDQASVWPKYLPLDLRLVDKLELVLSELRAQGIPARNVHVMSGYRTPHYNGPGGSGRAKLSRHTYGDAADIWVDDDGDGRMDDLNGDGQIDSRDADVIRAAAERVEQRYPELQGGVGVYRSNRHHGPFAHIDVRGRPARWESREKRPKLQAAASVGDGEGASD
jgi:hypothetical protein